MRIGWFAVLGWQSAFAASAFLAGSMIQGAAILGNSSYDAQPYQATLICWLALCLALTINLVGGKLLPRAEAVLLVVHILGFFGVLIPLVYMAEHNSSHDVFLTFQNGGSFKTQGLSWFVGMTTCAFAFGGADAAVHVSLHPLSSVPHSGLILMPPTPPRSSPKPSCLASASTAASGSASSSP
jgi:amino acid transporter